MQNFTTRFINLVQKGRQAGFEVTVHKFPGVLLIDFRTDEVVLYLRRYDHGPTQARIYDRATGEDTRTNLRNLEQLIESGYYNTTAL